MKRIFVLAMIAMFLFVPLSHAAVKTALTADGNQALFSLLLNENKESSVSTQGDAEAASTIPRIGGNWNSTGAGTIGGERFTTRGTASVVSFIDSDGYEVITDISQEYQIFDSQGRYIETPKSAGSFSKRRDRSPDGEVNPFRFPVPRFFLLFGRLKLFSPFCG